MVAMRLEVSTAVAGLLAERVGRFGSAAYYDGEALIFADADLFAEATDIMQSGALGDVGAAVLASLKTALKISVDAQAETERLKYITGGAGQAMTYARKTEEARAFLAAIAAGSTINPTDYPLLSASLGIDGPDLATIATVIIGMDAAWAQIGAAIEGVRLGTKKAIDDAIDEAAAKAAAEAAVWPA